jgi:hypothetical protein
MSKKETKSLVEITEEEFIKNIWTAIDEYDQQIYEFQHSQREFYKLWRDYQIDKDHTKHDLKFYLQDQERLFYKKEPKQLMGYKRM